MCRLKKRILRHLLALHQKRNFGTAAVTVSSKIYNHSGIDCQKSKDHTLVDIYSRERNRARTQKLTARRIAQQFEN
jgi:hypothetical protein